MNLKEAQEIVNREGFAWKVVRIEEISDFRTIIHCEFVSHLGVVLERKLFYSNIFDAVIEIKLS